MQSNKERDIQLHHSALLLWMYLEKLLRDERSRNGQSLLPAKHKQKGSDLIELGRNYLFQKEMQEQL